MKTLLELITIEMKEAFEAAGYDAAFAKVTLSNRPDLCEYQCNGAMAAAKTYKKAPIMIANDVVAGLQEKDCFEMAEAVNPGFINLKVKPSFAAAFLNEMAASEKLGVEEMETPKTIMVDYGGPNVAKPLHVGHLRSAIIGESVKRILRYKGNKVIGDIHLGDWGLQMGLIITELQKRKPELPYLMKTSPENIRKRRRLRSESLRKSTRRPALMQKNMKSIVKKHCRRRSFCRTDIRDSVRSGITLWQFL